MYSTNLSDIVPDQIMYGQHSCPFRNVLYDRFYHKKGNKRPKPSWKLSRKLNACGAKQPKTFEPKYSNALERIVENVQVYTSKPKNQLNIILFLAV